jgi:hypothetical protein
MSHTPHALAESLLPGAISAASLKAIRDMKDARFGYVMPDFNSDVRTETERSLVSH